MADPSYVNLTAPAGGYESQLADIKRRQKMAELLAQQGGEDIKVESVNGVPTPISPFQGLAKALQSGMGGYLAGKAAEEEAALEESENKAIADVFEGMKDTPDIVEPSVIKPDSETEGGPGAFTTGKITPGQKLSSSEKTNRIMAALIAHPKIAAVAPMYMQGMRNDIEDTRYKTGLERADAAIAVDANRYAKTQEQKVADDAESRRRFGITSEISRTNALDKPTMKFVTVNGPDGKPKRVMMSDAQIIALQNAGQNVSDTTIKARPSFTAQQFMKLGQELTSDMTTAGRLKGYMKDAKDIPQGFKLIAQDFANKFTTAFGGSLKGDALKIAMQNGTLQSLIGNLRIETVGGGVMTEQDAIRVVQALGGDLSLLRNKDVVDGQIRKILESKEARIKQNMQLYNRDAEINEVAPMEYSFQSSKNTGFPNEAAAQAAAKASGKKSGDEIKVTINGQTGTMVVD